MFLSEFRIGGVSLFMGGLGYDFVCFYVRLVLRVIECFGGVKVLGFGVMLLLLVICFFVRGFLF